MSPKSRSIAATHYLTSWANKRHFPGTQRRSRNWLSGMQFIEQDLDLFQIVCIEALDEPAVDRSEKLAGLLLLALIAPQACEAGSRAQLKRPGLLAPRHGQSFP